jgi:PPIC-type PPIASE domain
MRSTLTPLLMISLAACVATPVMESPDEAAVPERVETSTDRMRAAIEEGLAQGAYALCDSGAVTYADLTAAFASNSGFRSPMSWTPGVAADGLARTIAWQRLHLDDALTEGVEDGSVRPDAIRERARDLLHYHLLTDREISHIVVTDEEVRAFYDENLELFALPFQFHMRMIFKACYAEHTVVEGETLTSIAEAISEDPAMAIEIRDSLHRRLLTEWDVPVEEIDEMVGPLEAGQRLLVPMSPEGRAAVHAELAVLATGISNEASFVLAARAHSDSEPELRGEELGPFPQRDQEFLPEFVEAARTLAVGDVSDIIETKHGFQIIMVTRKRENEYHPFENMSRGIERRLHSERVLAAMIQWQQGLLESRGVVLHDVSGVMLRDQSLIDSEEIVAEIPGRAPLTMGEFQTTLLEMNPADMRSWRGRQNELLMLTVLLRHVDALEQEAEALGWTWIDPLVEQVWLQAGVASFLNQRVAEEASVVSEEMLRAHWEENPDLFTEPSLITYRQIVRAMPDPRVATPEAIAAIHDEAVAELTELAQGITTHEEFMEALLAHSDAARGIENPQDSIGLVANRRIERLPSTVQALTEEAEVGDLVGPVDMLHSVVLLWIEDRTESHRTPFEEAMDRVNTSLIRERRGTVATEWMDRDLEAVNFRFVRPEPEAPGENPEP